MILGVSVPSYLPVVVPQFDSIAISEIPWTHASVICYCHFNVEIDNTHNSPALPEVHIRPLPDANIQARKTRANLIGSADYPLPL